MIYPNQIAAYEKIAAGFEHHRYVALVAQMQSGKSDTFFLTAFESLRLGKVERVVIFTGNSDLVLKKQTLDGIIQFSRKYIVYLRETRGIAEPEALIAYESAKRAIRVVWASQLMATKNTATPPRKTLFIWEESHYAQSKTMQPFIFLQNKMLPPSGGDGLIAADGNYILSVSATPFSEFAAAITKKQDKAIVYLTPGARYLGVQYFLDHGIIEAHDGIYSDFEKALLDCKERFSIGGGGGRPVYGIVRAFEVQTRVFQQIATRHNWVFKIYNMKKREIDIRLEQAPQTNTIVFIKGALRMGQQVCKDHVGFCYEAGEVGSTDTILQGLVGRMCSFCDTALIMNIRIYLHRQNVDSGEIRRYAEFVKSCEDDGAEIIKALAKMPHRAMNIEVAKRGTRAAVHTPSGDFVPMAPIHIPNSILKSEPKTVTKSKRPPNKREYLMSSLCALLNESSYSSSNNRLIEARLSEKMVVHKWSDKSHQRIVPKMVAALKGGEPFRSSAKNAGAVHVWCVDKTLEKFPEFSVGDVIIELSISVEEAAKTPNMPHMVSVKDDAAFVHSLLAGTRDYQKKLVADIGVAADIPEHLLNAYLTISR